MDTNRKQQEQQKLDELGKQQAEMVKRQAEKLEELHQRVEQDNQKVKEQKIKFSDSNNPKLREYMNSKKKIATKAMSQYPQEYPLGQPTISIEVVTAVALLEEFEILQEQVESLKQLLDYEEQQRQYIEQELRQTNQELDLMNYELQKTFLSEPLTLEEAQTVATAILTSEQSTAESLAQLLSAIYGSTVTARELKQKKVKINHAQHFLKC